MTFMEDLTRRMAAIDVETIEAPDSKIEEGETKIGVAGEEFRRLWGVRKNISAQLDKIAEQHQEVMRREQICGEKIPHDELHHGRQATFALGQTVNALMWQAVRHQFPAVAHKNIVIREGWTIVTTDSANGQTEIQEFLEFLVSHHPFM